MNKITRLYGKKYFLCMLAFMLASVAVFSGCGTTVGEESADDGTDSVQVDDSTGDSGDSASEDSLSFDDVLVVKNSDGSQLSMYIYSDYMELINDYVESGEADGLIDKEYVMYDPSVMYLSTTSELMMEIYVTDVGEALEDYTPAEYLDVYTIQLKLSHDDISRGDNEVYSGIEFRRLDYTGRATDGTAYTVYNWIGIEGDFFLHFRVLEYNGSDSYIAYDDLSYVVQAVMDSIIVK